jgi:regulator of protease activity HflC (stomatin/prohibitin superfamily)
MNIDVVVVVRPDPREIYQLETDVGPQFYDSVVKAAVFAAARDAAGQFDHMQIATNTHDIEKAIHAALVEHLRGKHVELSEVAIQHFDLPPEVELAAHAIRARAEAERTRIQAVSTNLSPNYVRLQALESLAHAMSDGPNQVMVLPVGKDGLPGYFAPFLNPFGNFMGNVTAAGAGAGGKKQAAP